MPSETVRLYLASANPHKVAELERAGEQAALPGRTVTIAAQEAQARGSDGGHPVLHRLLQPGGDEKAALRRQLAHEELEYRRPRLAVLQVGLDHVELVEVGEQRARGEVRVVHGVTSAEGTRRAGVDATAVRPLFDG